MKKLAIFLGLLVCSSSNAANPCGVKEPNNVMSMKAVLAIPLEELINSTVSSSNKTPTCINQAPSTISSYSYKDIQRMGARTLADVLTLVPGIQMQTIPNGRQRIWMRGVQAEFNNKVALYVDNVPIKDAFGGFAIDEGFPVESIEKVEIIRGPGSALYGSNAFSGVINIFTFQAGKKRSDGNNSTKQLKNALKLGIGESDTHLAYATVEQTIADAVDVKLEGKWLDTDGRKPDYNRLGKVNTQSNSQELAYLHISLAALDGDLLFNGFYSQFDNRRVDKPLPLQNNLTDKNVRFSLNYKHVFSDRLSININAYHTETQRLEHEVVNPQIVSSSNDRVYLTHTTLSGLYSTLNYQPLESNQMIAGFEFKREAQPTSGYKNVLDNTYATSILNPSYENLSLATYSVFLQDTQDIFSKKTQLTAGLRFDILDLFKKQFNYRLGLTHDFDNGVYAKLLYGTAYRAPSFVEFTVAPPNIALPDVETVSTLEGQIGYQAGNLNLSLTGYRNNYKNVIERSNSFNTATGILATLTPPGQNSGVFSNFDHQIVVGSEFEAQLTFQEHWKGFLNASWSHARSLEAHQSLPLLANWTATTGLEWSDKIYSGDLVFNNQVVIYGKRKDWQANLWKNSVELRLPNRNPDLTDGFATWNSSLHYKLPVANKTQTLDFDLSAYNLLNKTYYTQSLTPPARNATAFFDTQYQGRQVRFSLSYSW